MSSRYLKQGGYKGVFPGRQATWTGILRGYARESRPNHSGRTGPQDF